MTIDNCLAIGSVKYNCMKRFVIHKNKPQAFKCQLMIEGASTSDAEVRMCLELDDNRHVFFNGTIKGEDCTIKIPKLTEFKDQKGKMFVEAIVDSTYFKLYESEFELKNSLAVKMVSESIVTEDAVQENKIGLRLVALEEEKDPEQKSVQVTQPAPIGVTKASPVQQAKPVDSKPVVNKPSPARQQKVRGITSKSTLANDLDQI